MLSVRPSWRGGTACLAYVRPGRYSTSLVGRLGDPSMSLVKEPRLDKKFAEHFKDRLIMGRYGVIGQMFPHPLRAGLPLGLLHRSIDVLEEHVVPMLLNEGRIPMPDMSNVEEFREVVTGADGNAVELHIAKPKDVAGDVPGILHLHGGGMTLMSTKDPLYRSLRARMARLGFVVVSVEFRNASGKLGRYPYPAGLNDCMSALSWTHAHRRKLGISRLILSGESGGGNLCLSTALRARREGRLHEFDGVFALCPFIAGPRLWESAGDRGSTSSTKLWLKSLRECRDYLICHELVKVCARLYDPERRNEGDPCAWPLVAEASDLRGLPPHVVSVNELDPLRDEGLAYCERLREAGVRAESRTVLGTPHAGDLFAAAEPGVEHFFLETVGAMKSFADSL
ncbi:unnamed protein product [Prorocentrum cordatum]|uniref:Alpha/beta hydrolase fold-3 domain-containing protein n=1 Tax=Prorocentrum cordatum TaxID=2364126 RepID=A0ABN9WZ08_9DINO|nr:unnamed protein product [Polarella glacialis]|mmetsp:Transcript_27749/g.73992  ORF Transcript_27749/g.73992 Transcript_27749/m.73992 type:complete len:397 (+) Transcript_27749:87-1277(+)